MTKIAILLVLLLGLNSSLVMSDEPSLQDQITEIKNKIEELQQSNDQLRSDIESRDEEVNRLKQQLQELEEQIGGVQ